MCAVMNDDERGASTTETEAHKGTRVSMHNDLMFRAPIEYKILLRSPPASESSYLHR